MENEKLETEIYPYRAPREDYLLNIHLIQI